MQFLTLVLSSELLTAEAKLRPFLDDIAASLDASPDVYLKSPQEKKEEADARQEAQAQQEARVRQLTTEQAQIEDAGKAAEHERALEKQDEKFKDDLILTGMKGRRAA